MTEDTTLKLKMDEHAQFILMAHTTKEPLDFARAFVRLALTSSLEGDVLKTLFRLGISYHQSIELPDTSNLNWKEAIIRCLESLRSRAETPPAAMMVPPPAMMIPPPETARMVPPPATMIVPPPEAMMFVPPEAPNIVPPPAAPVLSPVPALRKCPPVPAPRKCPPVPAPRKCPPVPAPLKCPPVPAPCKCPPVPAPCKCPPVPAPRKFPPPTRSSCLLHRCRLAAPLLALSPPSMQCEPHGTAILQRHRGWSFPHLRLQPPRPGLRLGL